MRRREWSTLNRSDCLPQETKDLGPGRSKFWIGTRENVEFESCVDQFEVVFHVGVVQCGAKPAPDVLHELCVPAGWMIRLRLVETQFGCLTRQLQEGRECAIGVRFRGPGSNDPHCFLPGLSRHRVPLPTIAWVTFA